MQNLNHHMGILQRRFSTGFTNEWREAEEINMTLFFDVPPQIEGYIANTLDPLAELLEETLATEVKRDN